MKLPYFLTHNILLALAVVLALGVATAQSDWQSDWDRFRLFNDCEPMYLVVETLSAYAAEIDLARGAIQAAVESRLRSARLYKSERLGNSYLYVNVNVTRTAFNILFMYRKEVLDLASGLTGGTITWWTGTTGAHGRDASYILSAVSELMDEFLIEYLRVNEEAC